MTADDRNELLAARAAAVARLARSEATLAALRARGRGTPTVGTELFAAYSRDHAATVAWCDAALAAGA